MPLICLGILLSVQHPLTFHRGAFYPLVRDYDANWGKQRNNWKLLKASLGLLVRPLSQYSAFSSPEPTILLACGRKSRALGATISGMRRRCRLRETGWAEFGYFHCYFKMVAPRALVFRPLVKGNEALGTRLNTPRLSRTKGRREPGASLRLPVFARSVLCERHRSA